ncbi:unnamed protein product [Amoebophrya sp. A120]|nr:unnamed protein product [Amoebophrya sp. A120]|eukprot:GSA120T00022234001.1
MLYPTNPARASRSARLCLFLSLWSGVHIIPVLVVAETERENQNETPRRPRGRQLQERDRDNKAKGFLALRNDYVGPSPYEKLKAFVQSSLGYQDHDVHGGKQAAGRTTASEGVEEDAPQGEQMKLQGEQEKDPSYSALQLHEDQITKNGVDDGAEASKGEALNGGGIKSAPLKGQALPRIELHRPPRLDEVLATQLREGQQTEDPAFLQLDAEIRNISPAAYQRLLNGGGAVHSSRRPQHRLTLSCKDRFTPSCR